MNADKDVVELCESLGLHRANRECVACGYIREAKARMLETALSDLEKSRNAVLGAGMLAERCAKYEAEIERLLASLETVTRERGTLSEAFKEAEAEIERLKAYAAKCERALDLALKAADDNRYEIDRLRNQSEMLAGFFDQEKAKREAAELQVRDLREALESIVRVSKTPSTIELAQLALDGKWTEKRVDAPLCNAQYPGEQYRCTLPQGHPPGHKYEACISWKG